MAARIHGILEGLMCKETKHAADKSCCCATLHRHYGSSMFKCTFPSCELNRSGFATYRARQSHVEIHGRPWKCSVSSCPYAAIGFATRRAQNNHWAKMHRSLQQSEPESLALGCFTRQDLEDLLLELTKAGDIDQLEHLCPRLAADPSFIVSFITMPAMLLAGKLGSLPMVKVLGQYAALSSRGFERETDTFFRLAAKSENLDLFRWLLDATCKTCGSNYKVLAEEAFATNSHEIYAEWENFLLDASLQPKWHWEGDRQGVPAKLMVAFSNPAFRAAQKGAIFEARLIQTWTRLANAFGPFPPRFLGYSLVLLARSASKSTTLAAELLRQGALIDYPHGEAVSDSSASADGDSAEQSGAESQHNSDFMNGGGSLGSRIVHGEPIYVRGPTALHCASRVTTERAARFMKYLLEEGANPKYGCAGVKPANEKGAKMMQKWVGESWKEVVARTEQARERRKRLRGSGKLQNDQEEHDESDGQSPRPKRSRTGSRRATLSEFYHPKTTPSERLDV
ncbi:hypothetical protein VTI74DRAFT_6339 [Chaetomium olivicolor]